MIIKTDYQRKTILIEIPNLIESTKQIVKKSNSKC